MPALLQHWHVWYLCHLVFCSLQYQYWLLLCIDKEIKENMGCLTKNCGNEGANCSYLGMISQAVLEITLNQRAYDWNLENI